MLHIWAVDLQWMQSIQTLATTVIVVLMWVILRAFQSGRWIFGLVGRVEGLEKSILWLEKTVLGLEKSIPGLEKSILGMEKSVPIDCAQRLLALERSEEAQDHRLDKGGEEMSSLASHVQGLPERLRRDFQPRERADDLEKARLADSANLWAAIRRIEEHGRRR